LQLAKLNAPDGRLHLTDGDFVEAFEALEFLDTIELKLNRYP
jgi:hypothetical protein